MDILELIKTRRSVRQFQERPVRAAEIRKILEAGRWAPSGLNNQPWRFAVITNNRLREEFSRLTHYARVIKSANVLIAVFLDTENSYNRMKDIQAVGACIQNMLLEAHSIGIGSVWLGEILKSEERIGEILNLDKGLELMAVLAFGYPDKKPKAVKRRAISELLLLRD
ncbi:MAG: nitroreductase [Nitrospirae bacterium]|nr:nitroreductase [Nitrospirota bacterium]